MMAFWLQLGLDPPPWAGGPYTGADATGLPIAVGAVIVVALAFLAFRFRRSAPHDPTPPGDDHAQSRLDPDRRDAWIAHVVVPRNACDVEPLVDLRGMAAAELEALLAALGELEPQRVSLRHASFARDLDAARAWIQQPLVRTDYRGLPSPGGDAQLLITIGIVLSAPLAIGDLEDPTSFSQWRRQVQARARDRRLLGVAIARRAIARSEPLPSIA